MICFHYNLKLFNLSLTRWAILRWLKVYGFSTPKNAYLCSVPSHVLNTYMQTNTHTLSAWESGPLDFLGPHPAFAAALQSSTSFTWE